MNKIELKDFGVIVEVDGGAGTITSTLKDNDLEHDDHYNVAIDAVESMILSCACAGVDIKSSQFTEALQTTLDAIYNQYM